MLAFRALVATYILYVKGALQTLADRLPLACLRPVRRSRKGQTGIRRITRSQAGIMTAPETSQEFRSRQARRPLAGPHRQQRPCCEQLPTMLRIA